MSENKNKFKFDDFNLNDINLAKLVILLKNL